MKAEPTSSPPSQPQFLTKQAAQSKRLGSRLVQVANKVVYSLASRMKRTQWIREQVWVAISGEASTPQRLGSCRARQQQSRPACRSRLSGIRSWIKCHDSACRSGSASGRPRPASPLGGCQQGADRPGLARSHHLRLEAGKWHHPAFQRAGPPRHSFPLTPDLAAPSFSSAGPTPQARLSLGPPEDWPCLCHGHGG